jgi:hypothetical protein
VGDKRSYPGQSSIQTMAQTGLSLEAITGFASTLLKPISTAYPSIGPLKIMAQVSEAAESYTTMSGALDKLTSSASLGTNALAVAKGLAIFKVTAGLQEMALADLPALGLAEAGLAAAGVATNFAIAGGVAGYVWGVEKEGEMLESVMHSAWDTLAPLPSDPFSN